MIAWSYSKLRLAKNRNYAYYLQYIKKIKAKVNKSIIMGNIYHYICDTANSQKMSLENANIYTIKAILSQSKYADIMDPQEILVHAPSMENYLKILRQFKYPYSESELNFGLTTSSEIVDFFDPQVKFRGIIDFISIGEKTVIIDLKTSYYKDQWDQLDYYTLYPKIKYPLYGGIYSLTEGKMYWKNILHKKTLAELQPTFDKYETMQEFLPNYAYCNICLLATKCDAVKQISQ